MLAVCRLGPSRGPAPLHVLDLRLQPADPRYGALAAGRPLVAEPLLDLQAAHLLVEVADGELLVHDLGGHLLQLLHQRGHARAQLDVRLRRLHVGREVAELRLSLAQAPEALLHVDGEGLRGMPVLERARLHHLRVLRDLQPPHGLVKLVGRLTVVLKALLVELEALVLLHPALADLRQLTLDLLEPALGVHALHAVAQGSVVVLLGLDARAQRLEALLLGLDLDVELVALLLEHLDLLAGVGEPAL
mmetsp:Transcript_31650/g.85793  ORF Transcript_31650/g.85793 Transcript_31650/m.85793 type:complete len:247 (+) Transcript_31650:126-866(+)